MKRKAPRAAVKVSDKPRVEKAKVQPNAKEKILKALRKLHPMG